MPSLSPQLQAALLRALLIAVPSGALVTLTALQQGTGWQTALVAGGISFLVTGIGRGLFEGIYDAYRGAHGLVRAGDVKPLSPPPAA